MSFDKAYKQLNPEQKEAVDTLDGPLMVIAGPGTGKTQLLGARVANILKQTDTPASSILCLTFTESGALNMRERLTSFIGKEAYNVYISTYHTFGSDLIRSYPEYFAEFKLLKPVDELIKFNLIKDILSNLPFSSPLKYLEHKPKTLVDSISELKRALVDVQQLKNIAKSNKKQQELISPKITKITKDIKSFPRTYEKAAPLFTKIIKVLYQHTTGNQGGLADMAYQELSEALDDAQGQNSSKPLTAWKNKWLHKTAEETHVFTDPKLTQVTLELASLLEKYNLLLSQEGYYDFDDMILKSIEALKTQPELKANLQERFLYTLLDEFQDTNKAQFELVKLLNDNPVNERRPNVMAVGDDDQAIYAFQGAEISNMLDFLDSFVDVKIINLSKNYRSHPEILHIAHNLSNQVEQRLHKHLKNVNKELIAASASLPPEAQIERHEFKGIGEEYSWVAKKIAELIKQGVNPEEIAVLAPKHKYLEQAVSFINERNIPAIYEKRENILEAPIVLELKLMTELVAAIKGQQHAKVAELMSEVLSLPAFNVPVKDIWNINWQYARSDKTWPELATSTESISKYVWFFLALAERAELMPLEVLLDTLIGTEPLEINGVGEVRSPLADYYFSDSVSKQKPFEFYETLSHLTVIREKIREYQSANKQLLNYKDFLHLDELFSNADKPLINTHTIAQSTSAINLMTAYKAKGLEFEHVFLLSCQDEVWGSASNSGGQNIKLPENLRFIRAAKDTDDDKLRLLYVAITRAKTGLYLTSHELTDAGKQTSRIKYFDEQVSDDGEIISKALPERVNKVRKLTSANKQELAKAVELAWHDRHAQLNPDLKSLLKDKLKTYQMSPTHLNKFTDLVHGGPRAFLLETLLRFPKAPNPDSQYGTAYHETLDWYQAKLSSSGKQPSLEETINYFERELESKYLTPKELELYKARGINAIKIYLEQRAAEFSPGDLNEQSFSKEGVFVGDAHLRGKIDKLKLDKAKKTATVIDYKTGSPSRSWKHSSDIKHYNYRKQLYFYKLLVEGSHSFKDYKVNRGVIDFVEPDDTNKILQLDVDYNEEGIEHLKKLIVAVWDRIQNLDFPDTSRYSANTAGTKKFEKDLISGTI